MASLNDQQSLLSSDVIEKMPPASSISTFLTSAVTDLLSPGKFNLPTPATAFPFFVVHRILICCVGQQMLCGLQLSFCTVCRRDRPSILLSEQQAVQMCNFGRKHQRYLASMQYKIREGYMG